MSTVGAASRMYKASAQVVAVDGNPRRFHGAKECGDGRERYGDSCRAGNSVARMFGEEEETAERCESLRHWAERD